MGWWVDLRILVVFSNLNGSKCSQHAVPSSPVRQLDCSQSKMLELKAFPGREEGPCKQIRVQPASQRRRFSEIRVRFIQNPDQKKKAQICKDRTDWTWQNPSKLLHLIKCCEWKGKVMILKNCSCKQNPATQQRNGKQRNEPDSDTVLQIQTSLAHHSHFPPPETFWFE